MNENTLADIAMHLGRISRSLELIARGMSRWDDGGIADPGGYVAQLDRQEPKRPARDEAKSSQSTPEYRYPVMSAEEAVRAANAAMQRWDGQK